VRDPLVGVVRLEGIRGALREGPGGWRLWRV